MSHGRRRRRQSARPAWLPLAGVLAAVALLSIGAFAVFAGNDSRDALLTVGQGGSEPVTVRSLSAPASACLDQVRAAEDLVNAAQPAAESWKAYNDARTREVSGQITAKERDRAMAAAAATGRGQVEAFQAAESRYASFEDACGKVKVVDYPREQEDAARNCLSRSEVAAKVAAEARAVVRDWAQHLDRLERRDKGTLSSQRYESQWNAAYQNAPANLDRFLGPPVAQYRTGDQARLSSQERLRGAPECRLVAEA